MSNEFEMLKRLQLFMRDSEVYKEIFKAQSNQLNQYEFMIEELQNQFIIDTATWALRTYELALGIESNSNKPISERRSKIKAKMRGTGKLDSNLIKLTMSSWTGGNVDVSFTSGKIRIKFTDLLGIPENMNDVYIIIEDIKPAHLDVLYEFLYNTHNMLSQFTHEYLNQYTHQQLREEVI